MKKNIFKIFLCISAAMIFVACDDTMDDKDAIDASHEVTVNQATVSNSMDGVTFASATVNIPVSDIENVIEVGVEVAAEPEFAASWFVKANEITETTVVSLTGLEEEVTYYVRPYIYTVNGGAIYGETTTFTTAALPAAPGISEAENITFYSADFNLSLTDIVDIAEVGVLVDTLEDFSTATIAKAAEVAQSAVVTVSGLVEMKTYYAIPYLYTTNGKMVLGNDVKTFTTAEAPGFSLDGTYTVTEYATEDAVNFTSNGNYEMTIAFAEGSETEVLITNLWDGGMTITGTYNPETKIISVAPQVIYVHPSYGDVYAMDAFGGDVLDFKFTPKGGAMESGVFGAIVPGVGSFGYFKVQMQHL